MTLWYLARALGLVALIGFTASTCLGALSTVGGRSPKAVSWRLMRQLVHRSTALMALGALAVHVVLVVIDSYVDLSAWSAAVPFTAGYRPLALGLGTLGVYAFVLTAVSGASRGRLATSPSAARAWRAVHVSAYIGWALSMIHGVLAGTDTGRWWSTAVYVACGIAVAASVSVRFVEAQPRRHQTARGTRVLVGEARR